jgi:hypothetical protein
VTVTPDTKDWTWVLGRPCPECGFDASSFSCLDVAAALRENAGAWRPLLELPDARRRPAPSVWSALEYACHVRDVFRIFDGRLARILAEDDPLFESWDQDRTAVEDRYGEQDPATVAGELEAAGGALAGRFDEVAPEEWSRPGRRSDGASFTVDSFSRYLLHDPVHHVHDVTLGLEAIRGRR